MAKTYIFGIGGTGARVLRSLTMLMASGMKELDGATICPIIIDYDEHNGDKDRAIETMSRYTAVHNLVMRADSQTKQVVQNTAHPRFFTGELRDILNHKWSWMFGVDGDNKQKFSDYIGYNNIDNYSPYTQHIVDSLYDNNNAEVYTELGLNMTQGFQGNPNIGSVVFDKLKECNEFKTFVNDFTQGDKVVVIGSIFGGTGSSGIPKIVSAIRNNNNTNVKNAHLSVVLVLPYFAVDTPQDGHQISIKSNIFNSKTKAALAFYERSGINANINNIYYVGDKVPTRVEPHIGDKNQKNNAHIVEAISALSVVHAISSAGTSLGNKYKFNATQNISDGIGFQELVGATSTQWENTPLAHSMVHSLINFMYAVRYYMDELVDPDKRMQERQFYQEVALGKFENKKMSSVSGSLPVQDYCFALYQFICKNKSDQGIEDGFWQWVGELHAENHGAHRLKMFDMDCDNICDLLIEKSFRYVAKNFLDRLNDKKPLFTYDEAFDTEMSEALMPYRKGQKKLTEQKPEDYPWILNDMLSYTAEHLRTTKAANKQVPDDFKMIP